MASVEKRCNKSGTLIPFRIHVFHGRDEFGKQLPPFIKTVRVPPELNARQIETLIQRETVHFEEECELITAREKEEAAKAAEPKCISFEDFAVKVMEIKERTGKEKSTLARYQLSAVDLRGKTITICSCVMYDPKNGVYEKPYPKKRKPRQLPITPQMD